MSSHCPLVAGPLPTNFSTPSRVAMYFMYPPALDAWMYPLFCTSFVTDYTDFWKSNTSLNVMRPLVLSTSRTLRPRMSW